MDELDVFIEALKWIVLVFFAGFVGYFGKYLGGRIISRVHKKPSGNKPVQSAGQGSDSPEHLEFSEPASSTLTEDTQQQKFMKKKERDRLKQQKKLGKERIKQAKKSGQ